MDNAAKIDKILDAVTDLKVELARHLVHQENHAKDIKELKEYKSKDQKLKWTLAGILLAIQGFIQWLTHSK